jgi:hypothetical protein
MGQVMRRPVRAAEAAAVKCGAFLSGGRGKRSSGHQGLRPLAEGSQAGFDSRAGRLDGPYHNPPYATGGC